MDPTLSDDELERVFASGTAFSFASADSLLRGPTAPLDASVIDLASDTMAQTNVDDGSAGLSMQHTSPSVRDDDGDTDAPVEDDTETAGETAEPTDLAVALHGTADVFSIEGPVASKGAAADPAAPGVTVDIARGTGEPAALEGQANPAAEGAVEIDAVTVVQDSPIDPGAATRAEPTPEAAGITAIEASDSSVNVFDSYTLNMGTGLTFTLNDTGGAGAGTQALAGFQAAAALWAGLLDDDVNIVLDIGFQNLGVNTLGQAGSTSHVLRYTDVRTALTNDAQTADDTAAVNSLDAGAAFTMAQQDSAGVYGLDNNASNDNQFLAVNAANAKALGFTTDVNGGAIGGATSDASITFNNQFSWDFDQSNGVGSGLQDFVGVAFHEIGHALGFTSGVDVLDQNTTTNLEGFAIHGVLDMFRYSANSVATYNTRDLGYNTTSYFSLDNGATNLGLFSTGTANGDGQQASHWKDNQQTGVQLGIMDPTALAAGNVNSHTELDLRAFDVIGWNRVGGNQPVELFNGANVSQGTFVTIQDAEDAAAAGFRIAVDAATYAANPEAVTVDQNNLTIDTPSGVTPNVTLSGAAATFAFTGGGNANVTGHALANTLTGNTGNNQISAGAGDDTIFASLGVDVINGGGDTDTFDLSTSTGVNINWVNLEASSSQFRVDQGAGFVARGTLSNVENVSDSAGSDRFYGDAGDNTYTYSAGLDTFNGRAGTDTLDYSSMTSSFVWINLTAPSSQLRSNDGSGWVANGILSDVEVFKTTAQTDYFYGDGGESTFVYNAGRDFISAAGGDDTLDMGAMSQSWVNMNLAYDQFRFWNGAGWQSGGNMTGVEDVIGTAGNDFFYADAQDNEYFGGLGNDRFEGGFGADTFVVDGTVGDYALSGSGNTYTMTGISGTDTLIDVEFVNLGGTTYTMADLDLLI